MLAKTPISQQFYNWVSMQDPNETYDYSSCVECACGRFAREALGIKAGTHEFTMIWVQQFYTHGPLTDSLNTIARGAMKTQLCSELWTYGQLRERLEAQLPECVA